MFGRKKAKKEKTVEQKIEKYLSVKDFQKGQKKLAKQGWQVKAQSTAYEKSRGLFSRKTYEVIIVTFEREVEA